MNHTHFLVHRRASMGYDLLTEEEREAVDKAVSALANRPEKQWPKLGAIRLKSADPLFILHIDKSLRAIVHPTSDGQPEILELVRRETLLTFKQNGTAATRP